MIDCSVDLVGAVQRRGVHVPREALFEASLQPLDLAILVFLWFQPDGAALSHAGFVAAFQRLGWRSSNGRPIGRDAVYAAINRLIAAGYLVREQPRDDEGHLGPTVFTVNKAPVPPAGGDESQREACPSGFAVSGNTAHGETETSNGPSPQVKTGSVEDGTSDAPPTPPKAGGKNLPPNPPRWRRPRRRSTPDATATAARPSGSNPGETETPQVDPQHLAAAAGILASLGDHRDDLLLGERDIERLSALAATWLERGATSSQLATALTSGLPPQVQVAAGFVRNRLTARMPKVRASGGTKQAQRGREAIPDWCGTCDPQGARNVAARFIETADGKVARCPRCHPARQ